MPLINVKVIEGVFSESQKRSIIERITDAMVRTLKLPAHVVVARDIETAGNTSAASVPLALDRLLESSDLPSGGLALLVGFGAGLAYAAQVVELP